MFDRPKLEHAPVSDPVAPRRKVSREGLVLIKSLEGFQPRAWRRPDGRWAIGYGHSRSAREGLTVSEPDAELLLQYDLLPVVAALNDRVSRPLNQHQFDALASFALSVGVDAFVASDVLAALNAEGPEGAARALAARTEVDPALARAGRRRHAEWALFGTDPEAPVTVAALLAAPAPESPAPIAEAPAPDADVSAGAPSAVQERDEAPAPAPVQQTEANAPDAAAAPTPPPPPPPAFSLRYAAAVSHLLGEAPARVAPRLAEPAMTTPADAAPVEASGREPLRAPEEAPPPASDVEVEASVPTDQTVEPADAAAPPSAPPVQVEEPPPAVAAEPPAAPGEAPPPPPPTPDVDRQAVLAELMRRQMSPFAIQVRGPLPPLGRPTEPVAPPPAAPPAPKLRPPVAASGPMAAVLAGPLLLPEASTETDVTTAAEPLVVPAALAIEPVADTVAAPPLIEMEAAPVAPLVLTPPPALEPDIQRPVWSPEERHPQARSLETDLFSEDELAADIGLGPVLRHEIVETPGRRFDIGQLGAYAGMGAVGLVSLGAAVPAAQALLDEGAGPSGETLLVFAALALIGAGCSGISGFNLWRLWREAHARGA